MLDKIKFIKHRDPFLCLKKIVTILLLDFISLDFFVLIIIFDIYFIIC